MLRRIRDWLLRIPLMMLCVAAVVFSALFGFTVDRGGESSALFLWLLAGPWLVTSALVLARAHRSASRSRNAVVRFTAPIAAAVIFLVCTAYAGHWIASWFSTSSFPH